MCAMSGTHLGCASSMAMSANVKNVYIDCAIVNYRTLSSKILKLDLDQAIKTCWCLHF